MFEIELFLCTKRDLALNNLQWLIWHQTKPTKQTIHSSGWSNYINIGFMDNYIDI